MREKCSRVAYANRRAEALIESDDFEVEIELELAMEEINQNEKDFGQIIQVT
jgi:hypothetical protein